MLPLLFNNPLISIILIDGTKIKPPLKTKQRQAHVSSANKFSNKIQEIQGRTKQLAQLPLISTDSVIRSTL